MSESEQVIVSKESSPTPSQSVDEVLESATETNGVPETDAADLTDTLDESMELQKSLGLEPKAIVLAKVKGYRPWPAMVLDEAILPANVKKLKPKTVKLTKRRPLIVVPVRFFSDDTYIWIKSPDLKPLKRTEILSFLQTHTGGRKRKFDPLVEAYQLAESPPDMQLFNLWGSKGEGHVPETTDDLYQEEDEPPTKKLKIKLSLKNKVKKVRGAEEEAGYADYEAFERQLDELSDSDSEPEYDSDWGIGEKTYNFEEGEYLFEDPKEQAEFTAQFPSAKELAKVAAHYTRHLAIVHKQVAPSLLGKVKSEKEVVKELKQVEKVVGKDMPMLIFTRLKLFRALLVAAHRPVDAFPYKSVRAIVSLILAKVPLKPCALTMEDLVMPTPSETPAPEVTETNGASHPENGVKEETSANGTGATVVDTPVEVVETLKEEIK